MQQRKLVQPAYPQPLWTILGTYYNCPSTIPISQKSHSFYHHSFQPNIFQAHYYNLQITKLARNIHIVSEPSHMDHQHHFPIMSSHSHFDLAHLVNEQKSKNYTTYTKDLSSYHPSLLPLHSHKFQKKKTSKTSIFSCGSRTTTTSKRGLIFSPSPQYFSNLFYMFVAVFFKRVFWDLTKLEILS